MLVLRSNRWLRRLWLFKLCRRCWRCRRNWLLAVLNRLRRLWLLSVLVDYWRCRWLWLLSVLIDYRSNRSCWSLWLIVLEVNVSVNVLSVHDLLLNIVLDEVDLAYINRILELHEEICELEVNRSEWLCRLLSVFLSSLSLCYSLRSLRSFAFNYRSSGLLVLMEVYVNLLDEVPVLDDRIVEDLNVVCFDE